MGRSRWKINVVQVGAVRDLINDFIVIAQRVFIGLIMFVRGKILNLVYALRAQQNEPISYSSSMSFLAKLQLRAHLTCFKSI